jgi:predicted small lipoprotein YifL
MKTLRDRANRFALAAAMIAALGVSGCGRKGPLDPPPAALSNSQQPPGANVQSTQRPALGEEGNSLVPSLEPPGQPQRTQQASTTPPPPPKSFFLDFLINK